MKKTFFSFLSLLLAFLLFTETLPVMAAPADNNAEEEVSEEPVFPDSYYWPAQTDSIPGWPQAPAIQAEAAVLMDAYTGALLYAKNKDEKRYPASITKIMTTLLALENCDNLRETVDFSAQAVRPTEENSSTIWMEEGEQLRMNQSLYAVMLASANEVAYAVAEHTSGNLKKFVEQMNKKAKELGCEHTHFNNASGLPDERHYTTAYDMALISKAAWQNRFFRKIAGTYEYIIPQTNKRKEPIPLYNHHRLLAQDPYKGCVGGKTGYTSLSENTLVTFVRRGSVTLIAVVLKSPNASASYDDTRAIMDYGFDNFHRLSLKTKGTTTIEPVFLPHISCHLPVQELTLTECHANGYAVVPKDIEEKDLTAQKTLIPNAVGTWKIRTDYFYNNWKVGVSYSYLQQPFKNLFTIESE